MPKYRGYIITTREQMKIWHETVFYQNVNFVKITLIKLYDGNFDTDESKSLE